MRVLFATNPHIGHTFPTIALAWALRSAGHEVLLATTGDGLTAAGAGLQVADVAPDCDMAALRTTIAAECPDIVRQLTENPPRDLSLMSVMWARMAAGELGDGTVKVARDWRPDLVVHSQMWSAGTLAAAALGVPVVSHGYGFARSGALETAQFTDHMADARERHAAGRLPARLVLDVAPPSMVTPEPGGRTVRYVPYNGGGVLPPWLLENPGRPRIAVTLGTMAPKLTGLGPVEHLLRHAPDVDAEFVLALGDIDISSLGDLPPNVRPCGWLPLGALLPTCAGIVHHGGAGTTMTAAGAGVPQLMLPDGADRHINADAATARGLALAAAPEDLTPDLLRRLTEDDKLAHAAAEVRTETEALPGPADLVPDLVRFATA
ncbi:nucleotide disphospho-sugar-binding domain-containing protein [Streptomyces sp. NPDC058000]|uniref:nucleotide disphospho-sugar-binding domain-containing protein n=1 Tax=Streptomyces sp. NPDC058000 TaxID=3346299 RepID=UPI0036E9DCE1